MTDLLDRPATTEPWDQRRSDPHPSPIPGPEHWLLAATLVGAGAIHMAMVPSHLGESAIEGIGFLVAAWMQLGLGVAVLLRPSRTVLAAVRLTSVTLIAAWALSRTVGLPFGSHAWHAESVSLVDGVCVALEVAALLLAAGVLSTLARARGVALVGGLAAIVLATAAVASPSARDHAAHSHGDHGADGVAGGAVACRNAGGSFISFTGYMVHAWNVPGYESPDGMFTELNRRITCPDGTYHQIPLEDLGSRDTTCRNP